MGWFGRQRGEIGVNMIKMLCAHIKVSMDKENIL